MKNRGCAHRGATTAVTLALQFRPSHTTDLVSSHLDSLPCSDLQHCALCLIMFTGHGGRERRRVDLSGRKTELVTRNDILEQAKVMRMQREQDRRKEASSVIIQAAYRSHRLRRSIKVTLRANFDIDCTTRDLTDVSVIQDLLSQFLFFYQPSCDSARLQKISEILVASMRQKDIQRNYIQLILSEELCQKWISQMQRLLDNVFRALLRNFVPPFISIIFLVFSPEYWPFRPPKATHGSEKVVQYVLTNNASLVLREVLISKFPLDHPATSSSADQVNLNFLLLKTCLKLLHATNVSYFVRDIFTIPSLMNRGGIQWMQPLYSHENLKLIYNAVCVNNGEILSDIASIHGDVGEPPYPSAGWLMGNMFHFSMPAVEHENEDESLFAALATIVLRGPKSIFPSLSHAQLHDDMRDDDEEEKFSNEFLFDHLPLQLKQQLSFFTDRRFLNAVVRTVKHQDSLSEKFLSTTSLLSEILRVWQSARNEILSAVSFGTNIVQSLWAVLSEATFEKFTLKDYERISPCLSLFCLSYGHYLKVIDDEEFYTDQLPFSIPQITGIILMLRTVLIRLFWTEGTSVLMLPWACYLRELAASTFQQLRDRQSRKPFADKTIFVMTDQANQEFQQDCIAIVNEAAAVGGGVTLDSMSGPGMGNRSLVILRRIPVIVQFHQRVELFYRVIEEDRHRELRFHHSDHVNVRRNFLLEDAFDQILSMGDHVRGRIRVNFVDDFGLAEAGIDGGGLFKEFINIVCKQALDPQTGMFKETTQSEHYPSPASGLCREDHLMFFKFFGIIVGKLLTNRIQIEPRFANFFLRKLASVPTCIDDLRSLDPEISKSLLFLKKYDGNFDDLGLFFCVINDELGQKQVVELCPGGSSIPVTKTNRLAFMHQLADYKLNRQIRHQTQAFISGLEMIISRRWLQMFSPDEIQMLISGSKHAIDVEDMKANMHYTGFSENDILIDWFWDILHSMSPEDLSSLLRFFTSCSRAPLLGFRTLSPGLCLQKSPHADPNALPSSSTCVNMMRIPPYTSKEQMQEKLTYAIRSNAGFDLS